MDIYFRLLHSAFSILFVMRKFLLTIGMSLTVSGVMVFTSFAQPAGMAALRGHVPAAVSRLQAVGELPGATRT